MKAYKRMYKKEGEKKTDLTKRASKNNRNKNAREWRKNWPTSDASLVRHTER